MNPEVTVIIPTYNSEEYIARALKSVFNQTHQDLEVILIDDASTDSTVSIARSFREKRLRIITSDRNRGVSYSRNRGIGQARGKWIALLDSDDWYAPERLEQLLIAAKQYSADLIADDLFLIRDNRDCHDTLLQENHQQSLSSWQLIDAVKFVTSDRPAAIGTKRNWSLGYVKPLIRKEFLSDNNIQYQEDINVGEDFTLYLECLWHHAKFYLIDRPYYYYRIRELSLSTRKPIDYLSQSCQITQRFIDRPARCDRDRELQKVLRKNIEVFRQRLTYYYSVESLRQRKFGRAIEQVLAAPYVLIDIFRKIYTTSIDKLFTIVRSASNSKYSKVKLCRSPNQSRIEIESYFRKAYNSQSAKPRDRNQTCL